MANINTQLIGLGKKNNHNNNSKFNHITNNQCLTSLRKAAQVHRETRKYIQEILKPGIKLLDICEKIEDKILKLFELDPKGGIGFPVGVSMNNIAAHDSANPNDNRIFSKND